ncbi:MAG: NAD(P)H-hydrate epimerase [Phycisphaerae bacterium]
MQKPPTATRDQIRAFDRYATETLGVPGIVLMENAGRQIAEAALGILGAAKEPHVVILAGRGNNGGDAFVVARHLTLYGVRPKVFLVAPRHAVRGDAETNLKILEAMDINLEVLDGETETVARHVAEGCETADLIIDGLLGTGTRGTIRDPYASVIEAVNAVGANVLAIDIPSGLDCDTGRTLGPTIRADHTVTMAAIKKGFTNLDAEAFTGEIILADIGVPFTPLLDEPGEETA